MKDKLMGLFSGVLLSLVVYVVMCIIASIASWSFCFNIAEWHAEGRIILLLLSLLIIGACAPFKGE
jgi:hypothetical protein